MMMTNGFGAVLGAKVSAYVIDKYYTLRFTNLDELLKYFKTDLNNPAMKMLVGDGETLNRTIEVRDWHNIWLAFAMYALVITIAFAFLFKHKHDPQVVEKFTH